MKNIKNTIQPTSNLVREEAWGEFTSGDPVKVTADRLAGKRGYKWAFRARVSNAEAQTSWVEVYGGRRDHEGLHAFRETEVEIIKKPKRRKKNA